MGDKRRLIDADDLLRAVNMDYHDPKFDCLIYRAPVVDAVEVVCCAQCMYQFRNEKTQKLSCGIHGHTLMELTDQSFCSAGMTEAQWHALYGDELEDGDPLKQK